MKNPYFMDIRVCKKVSFYTTYKTHEQWDGLWLQQLDASTLKGSDVAYLSPTPL